MNNEFYDLFIIGGGINGCGLARDSSGRGFNVGLAEMNDLASGTSSASTKLIHGGLRYLEQFSFHLVRESLKEREILWHIAPHIIRPLRFILPHHKGLRSSWILRIGLFIYDHLNQDRELPSTVILDLTKKYGISLKKNYLKGFEYSDAIVDDSRLVILNARHAKNLGADIMVRTEVLSIKKDNQSWVIRLRDHLQGKDREVKASFVVNMSGPWISKVIKNIDVKLQHPPIRLVKGSHIVVSSLYDHDRAYIFQNRDGRIIFAIPYQSHYTLIGTTNLDYCGDPSKNCISEFESEYLCSAVNEYFAKSIKKETIIWSFSGIRQLYNNGQSDSRKTTRDYFLEMINSNYIPPLLNVYGGKITTYRKLSEEVMVIVENHLGKRNPSWTARIPLPGGDFPHKNFQGLEKAITRTLPNFDKETIRRLTRNYGTDVLVMYNNGNLSPGEHFGCGLYEREINWMIEEEWASNVDDILWRRSKLGLCFNRKQRDNLESWLQNSNKDNHKICKKII